MELADRTVFFRVLMMMSNYFTDPLVEDRQQVYWDSAVARDVTMAEWIYACDRAMQEVLFTKVPLFAVLIGYVTERRESRLANTHQAHVAQIQAQTLSEEDHRRMLERKKTHLDHKKILGPRYRPPCIHGAQGQSWWPHDPCDPELCDTPLPPAEARPHPTPMSQREQHLAIRHLIETVSASMDMRQV